MKRTFLILLAMMAVVWMVGPALADTIQEISQFAMAMLT